MLLGRQLNIKMLDLCNATCSFCGYSKDRLRERIRQGYKPYTLNVDALVAKFPQLRRKGIQTLHLTGGEPTMHARFGEFVQVARKAGFKVRTGTNGSLLDAERIDMLAKSGVDFLWYSLDTFPYEAHLHHRGFSARSDAMALGLKTLVERGLNVFGQTVLSRVLPLRSDGLPDLEGHMQYYHKHFGLNRFVFSYPMNRPDNGNHHLATEGGDAVTYTREELLRIIRFVLTLKDRRGPTTIVNPYLGLLQQIRELEGRDTHLPCMAGQDIFFLGPDEATLRPCYHHSDKVVDTLDDAPLRVHKQYAGCRDCRDQCFRDPSLMYGAIRNPADFLKQGWREPVFMEYAIRDIRDVIRHRGYRRAA
jgi:MoaA/NifB/PqqE/SkfB family radical SAM enzyme